MVPVSVRACISAPVDLSQTDSVVEIGRLSSPVRSSLFRIYGGWYDGRRFKLDDHQLSGLDTLCDHTGVYLKSEWPQLSFGRIFQDEEGDISGDLAGQLGIHRQTAIRGLYEDRTYLSNSVLGETSWRTLHIEDLSSVISRLHFSIYGPYWNNATIGLRLTPGIRCSTGQGSRTNSPRRSSLPALAFISAITPFWATQTPVFRRRVVEEFGDGPFVLSEGNAETGEGILSEHLSRVEFVEINERFERQTVAEQTHVGSVHLRGVSNARHWFRRIASARRPWLTTTASSCRALGYLSTPRTGRMTGAPISSRLSPISGKTPPAPGAAMPPELGKPSPVTSTAWTLATPGTVPRLGRPANTSSKSTTTPGATPTPGKSSRNWNRCWRSAAPCSFSRKTGTFPTPTQFLATPTPPSVTSRPNASSEPTKPPRQLTTQAGSGITCASGSRRSHTTIYSSCHAAGSANTSHCSTNRRSAASMATPQTCSSSKPTVGTTPRRSGTRRRSSRRRRSSTEVRSTNLASSPEPDLEPPADRRSDHFSGRYQHRTRGHQRKRWVHDHELHFQREWHQHRVLCFGQVVWHRQRRCSVDLRGLGAHLGQPAWLLRRRGRAHFICWTNYQHLEQVLNFNTSGVYLSETTDGLSETHHVLGWPTSERFERDYFAQATENRQSFTTRQHTRTYRPATVALYVEPTWADGYWAGDVLDPWTVATSVWTGDATDE